MDCVDGKCRETNGDVLGSIGIRRAVADPLSGFRDDGLTGVDVGVSFRVIDAYHSGQHHRVFVELGSWPGSDQPSGLRMWAMLRVLVAEFTRPMYSSMILILVPAAWILLGCAISLGIGVPG